MRVLVKVTKIDAFLELNMLVEKKKKKKLIVKFWNRCYVIFNDKNFCMVRTRLVLGEGNQKEFV